MSFFEKIVEYFSGTNKPYNTDTREFNVLNAQKVASLLNLDQRAQKDGENNIPRSSKKTKDYISSEIDEALAHLMKKARDDTINQIEGDIFISEGQGDGKAFNVLEITKKGEECLTKLYAETKDYIIQIYKAKDDLTRSTQSLEDFRINNGLDRQAMFPESQFYSISILFGMFTFESVVNAYSLYDVSQEGVAIFVTIFLISAVNIFIGFATGYQLLRQIFHINFWRKLFGLLSSILMILIGFGLNIGVGHYRDNLMTLASRVSSENLKTSDLLVETANMGGKVLEDLFSHPFQYGDFKSYIITLVGICFFVYAVKKGLDWDDLYPGYGKLSREEKAKGEIYSELYNYAKEDLQLVGSNTINDITGGLDGLDLSDDAIAERTNRINLVKERYKSWIETIKPLGDSLYSRYREKNQEFRTTEDPPCFSIDYEVPKEFKNPPEIFDATINNHKNKKDVTKVVNKYQSNISGALNDYLTVFQTIDALSVPSNKTRSADFVEEIDNIQEKYRIKDNNNE